MNRLNLNRCNYLQMRSTTWKYRYPAPFYPASLYTLIVAILLTVILAGCTSSRTSESRTITLAHAMHLTHPVSVAMQRMSDTVDEISDGRLKIDIYPSGQLGGERELLELVQIGAIGITKTSSAVLENIIPAMRVFSLPYLFRDQEHYTKVLWGETGDEILDAGTPYQLKGIGYFDAGMRSFYTRGRAINTPSDLAGLKIRVQPSVMAMSLIRTMGGSATPLSYGELYTAFQGGIVDGAENNPPSFYTSRHYEVTDYYVLNEHTAVPDVMVISPKVWSSLSEQEQSWLMEATDEAISFQRELWQEFEEEALNEVKKAGIEIITPDKEPFQEMVQPIYDLFSLQHPELSGWVERIREVE